MPSKPRLTRARIWVIVGLSIVILVLWGAVQLVFFHYAQMDF
ncbi:MAG: hypothetical protein BWY82_02231 [Verrucomicrobia bacterium ADurb.Bin474]|nr:MAG: hypothetical protein BWY82_02231 [Verrucomicrobia bacterium ADurb.Bin474]